MLSSKWNVFDCEGYQIFLRIRLFYVLIKIRRFPTFLVVNLYLTSILSQCVCCPSWQEVIVWGFCCQLLGNRWMESSWFLLSSKYLISLLSNGEFSKNMPFQGALFLRWGLFFAPKIHGFAGAWRNSSFRRKIELKSPFESARSDLISIKFVTCCKHVQCLLWWIARKTIF